MTLQNRVDPFGRLHAIPARGGMMGNRGILHDDRRNVLRPHAHRNWVACTISFKGRQRRVMAPHRYTELFFLDEVTALAAGHRPCATCRRERYRAFTRAWISVHGGAEDGRSLPHTIDRRLHAARIDRRREKVTYEAECADLPDGTVFSDGAQPWLIWGGRRFRWTFDGYTPEEPVPQGPVTVLTPRPTVAVLREGYRPEPPAGFETVV